MGKSENAKNSKTFFLIFQIVCFVFLTSSVNAQLKGGGLLVSPTRIELDTKIRSSELTLTNNGTETNSFRIKAVNMRMTENGQQVRVDGNTLKGEFFADKMIRFAPRKIRLKPGEQQTVRVMARISGNLPDGEYRTSLNFQWTPDEKEEKNLRLHKPSDGISVNFQFAYGINIPVILRKGSLKASGKINNLEIIEHDKNVSTLKITMEREGNRSLYGDISVYHETLNGEQHILKNIKGVAIYVPNNKRIFTTIIPVSKEKLKNGKIRVKYVSSSTVENSLIAEGSLEL